MDSRKKQYSSYSVSLSFDSKSTMAIKNESRRLEGICGNFYLSDHSVPVHLTLGIFHCPEPELDKLKKVFDDFTKDFLRDQCQDCHRMILNFTGPDTFKNKVIFLKACQSPWLELLNRRLHNAMLKYFSPGANRNYLPENWYPHVALAVKLTPPSI